MRLQSINQTPVEIEFQNVSFWISENCSRVSKTILKCVNGKFHSGELAAIMGPSGAGKSTLMNILAGYKTSNSSGQVLINGKERNLRIFRKLSCYIMQNDQLLPYLTVKEAMLVSANLKLGKNLTVAAKKMIVNEIIDALGLSECSNTRTISLSGGQRKRLSVALELVDNPPFLFLDEPTSGLDSSSCFQLISLLKSLAHDGRTIVCTIHQPSARLFEMFDNLYMLAEGQCIYQGIVKELVPFLASNGYICPSYHNLADYVMEVASGEHGEAVYKLVWAMNKQNATIANPSSSNSSAIIATTNSEYTKININSPTKVESTSPLINLLTEGDIAKDSQKNLINIFPTSSWTQFWILLKRTFITMIRNRTLTQMRLVSHVLVGAIIGMIYYGIGNDASKITSNAGCLFFTTLFIMFTAMMPTILTFPSEMSVFIREHLNDWYRLRSYYFAKTIADLPFQIIFTSVYVLIVYFLTNQPLEADRIGMFVLICILTSLVAQSLGLLIGAGMSVETGVFLGPVTTIPTILFSGFFVNFNVIPNYLKWVTYVSYVRYGFEGAMIAVYGMNREQLECNENNCYFRNPKEFLVEMSMEDANFWVDAAALTGIFIGLRIISYFVLRWKLHSIR